MITYNGLQAQERRNMRREKDSQYIETNLIILVSRIKPELKPFISIISVGFTLLLDTWEFPAFERVGTINTRVALKEGDRASLFYLMQHSGKSASEVISAALTRAKNSKVRPHDIRRATAWRVAEKHI
jgi:hypothetical protein